ncbi:MAG: helix-turn-helix domain-containing protein [Egibacteraceae bacterium]
MASEVPINGDVLRDLRALRMLSQEQLAHAAGCTREEISAYERGTRRPRPAQLDRIVDALERYPVKAAQWLLIKTPALDRALAQIEGPMNRREITKLLATATAAGASGVAGAVVLSPSTASRAVTSPRVLHDETLMLAGRYLTTSPAELLPDARDHLNVLSDALGRSLMPGERTGLLVDAAETASLAARVARLAGYRGEAAAFFALAQSLADESGYDTLRGLTRIAAAAPHGPLVAGGDGDWVTAVPMLTSGAQLVGSRGFDARWAQGDLAELYADRGRERESRTALELARKAGDEDHGDSFFSGRARFAHLSDVAYEGRCAALLGRSDEALARFAEERSAHPATSPWGSLCQGIDLAFVYGCAGEPDAMSSAANTALDRAAEIQHTPLAAAEIRGIRAKLEGCDDVACVRQLDQRLVTL